MDLVSYIALKFAVCIVWCGLGVYLFRPDSPAKLRQAFGFGFSAIILGVGLGAGIYYLASTGNLRTEIEGVSHRDIYFRIYVPARWILWSIMGYLMQQSAMSLLVGPNVLYSTGPASFFRTPSSRLPGIIWKLGGIAISIAADLPLMMASGGIENMSAAGKFVV